MIQKISTSDYVQIATFIVALAVVALGYVMGVFHVGTILFAFTVGLWGSVLMAKWIMFFYACIALVSAALFCALTADFLERRDKP